MQQILLNLVRNAIKFSHVHGDNIVISARLIEKPGSLNSQRKQLEVTVQDRGIGIPSSEIDRVFEPFFRTESAKSPNTRGHGLGLSICKNICESLGGKISVKSVE